MVLRGGMFYLWGGRLVGLWHCTLLREVLVYQSCTFLVLEQICSQAAFKPSRKISNALPHVEHELPSRIRVRRAVRKTSNKSSKMYLLTSQHAPQCSLASSVPQLHHLTTIRPLTSACVSSTLNTSRR
jgi:hypothetical protein